MSSATPGRRGRNTNGRGSSSARGNKGVPHGTPSQRTRSNNNARRTGSNRPKQQRSEEPMSDEDVLIAFMPFLKGSHAEATRIHEEYQTSNDQKAFLKAARLFLSSEPESSRSKRKGGRTPLFKMKKRLIVIRTCFGLAAASVIGLITTNETNSVMMRERSILTESLLPTHGAALSAVQHTSTSIQGEGYGESHWDPRTQVVVFYHAYISPDRNRSLDIIQEQLAQIRSLHTLPDTYNDGSPRNVTTKARVYLNTVGGLLDESFLMSICNTTLDCIHMNHFDHGFEELTLHAVQRFCAQNENHNVAYLHSKGSFHSKGGTNDFQRRSLTTAAMSRHCWQALSNNSCGTCGLSFSPMRSPFYPGNMWSTRCDYVIKLLDPTEFAKKTHEVVKEAMLMKVRGQLRMTLFPEMPSTLGIDRYTNEFWLGSHPSLMPCDVTSANLYREWNRRDATPADFALHIGPRKETRGGKTKIPGRESFRLQEYYLLAGHLLRWFGLYNEVPPPDSFFWNFFPDGAKWRSAVDQHGKKAVHEITKQFALD